MPDAPFDETLTHEPIEGAPVRAAARDRAAGGLAAGDTIGRYEIRERLGAGGMGEVYRARDPDLDREVAIKILRAAADGSQPSEVQQQRLLREAQAMARLSHPNIVSVYDVGTFRGRVFIAMEMVRGGTLRSLVADRTRSWRDRLAALIDAGRGLAEAHAAGVVHRDFKPDNVLISATGRAQVADFGLARGSSELETTFAPGAAASGGQLTTTLTRTGAIMGTPAYMSPEQHAGQSADTRSDQFSFAVAAYEALYGQRPFDGDDLPSLGKAVRSGAIEPPPADSAVPSEIFRALSRALQPAPEDRYPSLAPLLAALEQAAAPPRSRRPLVAGALALVVLAGVGVALFALGRDGGSRASEVDRAAEPSAAVAGAGSASRAALDAAVERYRLDLQACFEAEWRTDPLATGTVALAFEVRSSGSVANVRALDRAGIRDTVLDCMRIRVQLWRLPSTGAAEPVPMVIPFAMVPPAAAGIVALDDGSYEVDARVLTRVVEDSDVLFAGARVVPSLRNGEPNGFKLYSIQAGSIFEAIGLQNGDTVLGANGKPLATSADLMTAYAELKDAAEIRLSIVRKGEPRELSYRLRR